MQDGRHEYPISDLYVGKDTISDVNYFTRKIKFSNEPIWYPAETANDEVLYDAGECIGSSVFFQIDTNTRRVLTIIKAP